MRLHTGTGGSVKLLLLCRAALRRRGGEPVRAASLSSAVPGCVALVAPR